MKLIDNLSVKIVDAQSENALLRDIIYHDNTAPVSRQHKGRYIPTREECFQINIDKRFNSQTKRPAKKKAHVHMSVSESCRINRAYTIESSIAENRIFGRFYDK